MTFRDKKSFLHYAFHFIHIECALIHLKSFSCEKESKPFYYSKHTMCAIETKTFLGLQNTTFSLTLSISLFSFLFKVQIVLKHCNHPSTIRIVSQLKKGYLLYLGIQLQLFHLWLVIHAYNCNRPCTEKPCS